MKILYTYQRVTILEKNTLKKKNIHLVDQREYKIKHELNAYFYQFNHHIIFHCMVASYSYINVYIIFKQNYEKKMEKQIFKQNYGENKIYYLRRGHLS